jgi:hypothetical protein
VAVPNDQPLGSVFFLSVFQAQSLFSPFFLTYEATTVRAAMHGLTDLWGRGGASRYFDTVPVAVGLNLLKNGMLFVAAEFGNHALFQVQQLGDNDDEPTFSSHSPPDLAFEFTPRGLVNLMLFVFPVLTRWWPF